MFGFFKGKVDYERIFHSAEETYRHIYGNRSKTVEILGSTAFIDAWLGSPNVATVTAVISNEALKGDVPSLKQMIWVTDAYYKDAENLTRDKDEQRQLKTGFLKDRVEFCQKAIDLGLKDKSYPAMVSCVNLYTILSPYEKDATNISSAAQYALNGIVNYAQQFIESGYDAPDLIDDAKTLLKQYTPLAQLTHQINRAAVQDEDEIKEMHHIESLINKHGPDRAGEIIRESASNGNLLSQIFMSMAGLQIPEESRTDQIRDDIEKFTKMAAEGGDPGSQFNLALMYTKTVDSSANIFSKQDIDFLLKAKYWHEKAANQGFSASVDALKNISIALGKS
ncbi:hypothetical protein [Vreelandella glaciei]|uniref:hypothetical protein n=1 Tax=Vreelandella glaciei TaxID=186761 RepID=UPI0030024F86